MKLYHFEHITSGAFASGYGVDAEAARKALNLCNMWYCFNA